MPALRVRLLRNSRRAKDGIAYTTDDGKALGQRYRNLPNQTDGAAAKLEYDRWLTGRDETLAHIILGFTDGDSISVGDAFFYYQLLLTIAQLNDLSGAAAAHAGRPHIHDIISRRTPDGRLAPIDVYKLREIDQHLARAFGFDYRPDREHALGSTVVNGETWDGNLYFTSYLRSLPWPKATDPDVSRKVDMLTDRVGVTRVRAGRGWRFERATADGKTYRAKAVNVLPKEIRALLKDYAKTGVELEPQLAYETLRDRGMLLLPEIRNNPRFEEAQAANRERAKGLGYWVRRLSPPIPPTWTEEDRTPMFVISRRNGERRWTQALDLTNAQRAELQRTLDLGNATAMVATPDVTYVASTTALGARIAAEFDYNFESVDGLYAKAIGGPLDARLEGVWSDSGKPNVLLFTPKGEAPIEVAYREDDAVHVNGPWLFVVGAHEKYEAAFKTLAERTDAAVAHRVQVLSHGIDPLGNALSQTLSREQILTLARDLVTEHADASRRYLRESRYPNEGTNVEGLDAYDWICARLEGDADPDLAKDIEGLTPSIRFRELRYYPEHQIVERVSVDYTEVSHENFRRDESRQYVRATAEMVEALDECVAYGKGLEQEATELGRAFATLRSLLTPGDESPEAPSFSRDASFDNSATEWLRSLDKVDLRDGAVAAFAIEPEGFETENMRNVARLLKRAFDEDAIPSDARFSRPTWVGTSKDYEVVFSDQNSGLSVIKLVNGPGVSLNDFSTYQVVAGALPADSQGVLPTGSLHERQHGGRYGYGLSAKSRDDGAWMSTEVPDRSQEAARVLIGVNVTRLATAFDSRGPQRSFGDVEDDRISPAQPFRGDVADDEPGDDVIAPGRPAREDQSEESGTRAPLPESTQSLLQLWSRYLQDAGVDGERLEKVVATSRDAIATRAAAGAHLHSLAALNLRDSFKTIGKLDKDESRAEAMLAITRADLGAPLLSLGEFAHRPPEMYADAVRHLPLHEALGYQTRSLLLGRRALALHTLPPAVPVNLPDPQQPRGAQLSGFSVANTQTGGTTTALYDPNRGYVFDRNQGAYADGALRYALLLAATQDSGAVELSGSAAFKRHVADIAVELGITVTNDRGRVQRVEREFQVRVDHHPTERARSAQERADHAALDLGLSRLDINERPEGRLTIVHHGETNPDGTTTIFAKTSDDRHVVVALHVSREDLGEGRQIDLHREADGRSFGRATPHEEQERERKREHAINR